MVGGKFLRTEKINGRLMALYEEVSPVSSDSFNFRVKAYPVEVQSYDKLEFHPVEEETLKEYREGKKMDPRKVAELCRGR